MVSLALLRSAGEAVAAVAALEQLQAMSAFPAVPCAHLALRQHRLTDAGPEVPGTAEAFGAVCGPQAGVAFLTFYCVRLVMSSRRPLEVMLHGVVVDVPPGLRSIDVISLADTVAAAVSGATHGVPCASLPGLTAGQTGSPGVVAEFIRATLFILGAEAQLLQSVRRGFVRSATRRGGAWGRAHAVSARLSASSAGHALDKVGVLQKRRCVNLSKVSKERKINSHEAACGAHRGSLE